MSAVECFARLFDIMHINEINPFFYTKKDTHFSKSFYNSSLQKILILSISALEEEKSPL